MTTCPWTVLHTDVQHVCKCWLFGEYVTSTFELRTWRLSTTHLPMMPYNFINSDKDMAQEPSKWMDRQTKTNNAIITAPNSPPCHNLQYFSVLSSHNWFLLPSQIYSIILSKKCYGFPRSSSTTCSACRARNTQIYCHKCLTFSYYTNVTFFPIQRLFSPVINFPVIHVSGK